MKFPEMQHSQLFQIPVSSFFSYYLLLLASSAVLQEESIEVGGQSWKYMQGKERKCESTEGIEKILPETENLSYQLLICWKPKEKKHWWSLLSLILLKSQSEENQSPQEGSWTNISNPRCKTLISGHKVIFSWKFSLPYWKIFNIIWNYYSYLREQSSHASFRCVVQASAALQWVWISTLSSQILIKVQQKRLKEPPISICQWPAYTPGIWVLCGGHLNLSCL